MAAPEDVSGRFGEWIDEHYIVKSPPLPTLTCRRCGEPVGYLTKHAVVRHGDNIQIMPVAGGNEQLKLAEVF